MIGWHAVLSKDSSDLLWQYCELLLLGFALYSVLYYAPPLIGGVIKWCFCLTSVCLSVAYIGLKSKTVRPRKTKIGTEVAHVTHDSAPFSRSKGQRSRLPDRFTHCRVGASGSCSGWRGNVLAMRNCCYVAICPPREALRRPWGEERGAYRGGRPPTACSEWHAYGFMWLVA